MKRWRVLSCTILICLTAVTWVRAEVFQTILDNGLTVLIEEHHASPVVSVNVFVRTGSIYEQEYLGSGIFLYVRLASGQVVLVQAPGQAQHKIGEVVRLSISAGNAHYFDDAGLRLPLNDAR